MLRVDDIDPPRERAGAREAIERTLARSGFVWDGPVRRQSERLGRYRAALERLAERDLLYRCRCTRRELRHDPLRHARCRAARVEHPRELAVHASPQPPVEALRLRLDGALVVEDAVQGSRRFVPRGPDDDVVLRRRDGLIAYPLACAVDDAEVEAVVRGADLLEASAAQLAVLRGLGLAPPRWAHVPVALDPNGRKLGKSTGATAIDGRAPLAALEAAWRFLGQRPLGADELAGFWREAPAAWSLAAVPRVPARAALDPAGAGAAMTARP